MRELKLPINYALSDWRTRKQAREQYVREQEGRCYYCEGRLDGEPRADIKAKEVTPRLYPDTFFEYPVHLHHNHQTGMTIGAVHCHCNAVLWEYEYE